MIHELVVINVDGIDEAVIVSAEAYLCGIALAEHLQNADLVIGVATHLDVPLEKGRAYQAELNYYDSRLGGSVVTGVWTGLWDSYTELPVFKQIETGQEYVLPAGIVVWFDSLEAVDAQARLDR